ncbi:hypothetical protein [Absidia glauca]|uniref:MSP domain-containing protein n=1 Tax=Absidia glauca TaxID=4829 RepID=A0A163JFY3_ABSGL|nr:hypothetical protein [Absidia glauca]
MKKYATSVYSQKSSTSAKSGRSYFSFTTGATIWPIFTTSTKDDDDDNDDIDDIDQDGSPPDSLAAAKDSIWRILKKKTGLHPVKKVDDEAGKSLGSEASSGGRGGKWKKLLLVSPTQYMGRFRDNSHPTDKKSPVTSLEPIASSIADTESLSLPDDRASYQRHLGILVNGGGGSAKDIAEQKKRRADRRLYLMRLQHPPSSNPHQRQSSSIGSLDTSSKRQVGFSDFGDSSSSSTILSTPDDTLTLHDKCAVDEDDSTSWYSAAPRVMFVEPSPVPRFRNAPPAPPPSPPYLNIAFDTHRLVFTSPLKRGQTLTFSLQNTTPDDYIVVYKFLTSNSRLVPRRPTTKPIPNPSWSIPKTEAATTSMERYFVRPSAGMMVNSSTDIRLCLNVVPLLSPGETLKDKILVRWAVIQRGTRVEQWIHQLAPATRRKWLEMLLDEWPDQVVERKTRISIRFV